jgi:hypothetical protein
MAIELYKRVGSPRWQARILFAPGDVKRISTGELDKGLALQKAHEIAAEIKIRRKYGLCDKSLTFSEVFADWISRIHPFNKRDEYNRAAIFHILPAFGQRQIDRIKKRDVIQWRDGLSVGKNRKRTLDVIIRGCFNHAVDMEALSPELCPKIKSEKVDLNPRDAFTYSEMETIVDFLRDWRGTGRKQETQDTRTLLYYVVQTLNATGMRPGKEVESLTWNDCKTDTNAHPKDRYLKFEIRPETTKVRRFRELVAEDWLDAELNELQTIQMRDWKIICNQGYIFKGRGEYKPSTYARAFEQALREIGLLYTHNRRKRTLYSIRHHFITRKLYEGRSVHLVALQCGNSTAIIEKVYSKVKTGQAVEHLIR